jgi:hypothetical protein
MIDLDSFLDTRSRDAWLAELPAKVRVICACAWAESALPLWTRQPAVRVASPDRWRETPRLAIDAALSVALTTGSDVDARQASRNAEVASYEPPMIDSRVSRCAWAAVFAAESAWRSDRPVTYAREAAEHAAEAASTQDAWQAAQRHYHRCGGLIAEASRHPRFLDAMRLLRGPVMLRIRRILAMSDRLVVALDRLVDTGDPEAAAQLLDGW